MAFVRRRTPGQFSKRRRELMDAKDKPHGGVDVSGASQQPPNNALQNKSRSALGLLESNGSFIGQ